MNWLQKISQAITPPVQQFPPEDIIVGVLKNVMDGSGPTRQQPQGGWAYQQFQQMGPIACDKINKAAGADPSAYKKMEILAEASGCPWDPEMLTPQPEMGAPDPSMMMPPPMGQQEDPGEMPSAEIA